MPDCYQPTTEHPRLASGVVHVWRDTIDPAPADLLALGATLSTDEHARSARFHFERDRQRYIAARGILRRLLAGYLGQDGRTLTFRYGLRGKPDLEQAAPALQFNVSHRGSYALYAFVLDREVGIDIEFEREVPEALAIARNHFTPAETRLLVEADNDRAARECFFRLWTRKEAVIKAVGTGLSMPLDEFDVSSQLLADNAWRKIHVPARPDTDWSVRDLPVADEYRAAICVAGEPVELRFFRPE
ncbi:MAG TPA: 4'-phosphopantetheinyl transferase superfamily protein [Pirellulales bacterium]|jgi:4'-phosphopantetheinyl transferase